MKILLIGATGQVGSYLTADLLTAGVKVRALCKSADRAAALPTGVEAVVGDVMTSVDAAAAAFADVDAVFMLNQASASETVEGLMLLALARRNGVPRFVYQSLHRLDQYGHLPRSGAKLAIQRAIELSGLNYTILSPNFFFQNDDMVQAPLVMAGIYTLPIGQIGCDAVDVRDIAAAASIVLTTEGHFGQNYNIVGPATLTSSDYAANWSLALARPVASSTEIEPWRQSVKPYMPAWLSHDLAMMFDQIQQTGLLGGSEDLARLTRLLGRPPRSHLDFAKERAQHWAAS